MSESSYAQEFEKWLKKSKGDASHGDETEDDEYDKEEECFDEGDSDSIDDSDTEEEKSQKTLISKREMKVMPSSLKDSAPILVDDDDDDNICSGEKEQFEDEPPVLEPVQKLSSASDILARVGQKFPKENSLRNYSRQNQIYARKSSALEPKKSIKTYSSKGKRRHFSSGPSHNHSLKLKESKESGNIFDKFHSMSENFEDTPPPLIPSPEAGHLNTGNSLLEVKHPSHSPDFCAMEADSTSELSGMLMDSMFGSRRLSKASVHCDVSIECDSTCIIVSPASISNGEMEEARESSGIGENIDQEMGNDEVKNDSVADKEQLKTESDITVNATQVHNTLDLTSIVSANEKHIFLSGQFKHNSSHSSAKKESKDRSETFPVDVKTELPIDSPCGFSIGPPVFSMISSQLRPNHRSRKKRHTIDSSDTFLKSGKRSRTVVSPHDVENLSPPILTHVSETFMPLNSGDKQPKFKSDQSNKDYSCHAQNKGQHRKSRRRRCNTIPCTNLSEHPQHLSEDLCNFIANATELWQLQTRMHKLLSQLFPQLSSELDAMSPESSSFEDLLSDLVKSLEQSDVPSDKDDNQLLQSFSRDKHGRTSPSMDVKKTHISRQEPRGTVAKSASLLPPVMHSVTADGGGTDILKSASTHSHMSVLLSSNHYGQVTHSKQNSPGNFPRYCESSKRDIDPLSSQLSHLTLMDPEDCLRPLRIRLVREPKPILARFTRLSCSALQLLLPDLAVSLCIELAQSPLDLSIFIDNVIITNTRRKSKH